MNLMILDGNSIVNRAFYGVRPLTAPDGTPTNAVYGFLAILQRLLDELHPDALCVAFDLKDPTFRHRAYEGYKAQRKPMPDDLAAQMPVLKDVLDAMGVKRYEIPGYEADDILGTAASVCERKGWRCTVVTGDKDSLQLISENTTVCNVKTAKGQTETILYTPARFEEEYGFTPEKMVDLKALMGDSSDNIPGVPGIGEKTALELVRRYGSIAEIYADPGALEIKDGVRRKLTEGEESAKFSFWLATIFREVPLDFTPEDNLWNGDFTPALYPLFKRLGFNKFIEKWNVKPDENAPAANEDAHESMPRVELSSEEEARALCRAIGDKELLALVPVEGLESIELCDGEKVFAASFLSCGDGYNELLRAAAKKKLISHNVKDLIRLLLDEGLEADGFVFDTALAGYLLDATDGDYSLARLTPRYLGCEYAGAEAVWRLREPMEQKLEELGVDKLY